MAEKVAYEEFLEYIVKLLVDNPNDVKIDKKVDEMGVLLNLHLNPNDMGMVIGRQGATVRAIRTLLRVIGLKTHARVTLRVEEPEGSKKQPESKTSEELGEIKL